MCLIITDFFKEGKKIRRKICFLFYFWVPLVYIREANSEKPGEDHATPGLAAAQAPPFFQLHHDLHSRTVYGRRQHRHLSGLAVRQHQSGQYHFLYLAGERAESVHPVRIEPPPRPIIITSTHIEFEKKLFHILIKIKNLLWF